MTSIFIVHSVLAVGETRKVTREHYQQEKTLGHGTVQGNNSFSQILQQEMEEQRTDSIDCRTTTYGMDRRLHHFQYQAREYHY